MAQAVVLAARRRDAAGSELVSSVQVSFEGEPFLEFVSEVLGGGVEDASDRAAVDANTFRYLALVHGVEDSEAQTVEGARSIGRAAVVETIADVRGQAGELAGFLADPDDVVGIDVGMAAS